MRFAQSWVQVTRLKNDTYFVRVYSSGEERAWLNAVSSRKCSRPNVSVNNKSVFEPLGGRANVGMWLQRAPVLLG